MIIQSKRRGKARAVKSIMIRFPRHKDVLFSHHGSARQAQTRDQNTPRFSQQRRERVSRSRNTADRRSLVRQTETGMWEEALGARAETGRRRRRRKKKKKKKRRRRRNAQPLSLARSLARLSLLVAGAFLRTLCTTELGGLGFLRITREPHNSGDPVPHRVPHLSHGL